MKPVLIYILCSVVTVILSYFFPVFSFEESVANVLFTITGIVFSIGLSLTVISNTSSVKNKDIKDRIRKSIRNTRNNFILCFFFASVAFVLYITLPDTHLMFLNRSWAILICQVFSIGYFIYNFIAIQHFNEEIEDATA